MIPADRGLREYDWRGGLSITPPYTKGVFMACAMHLLLLVTLNGKSRPQWF